VLSAGTGYTREELDWLEAEWAYHLHGRTSSLSREDFQRITVWGAQGVPADAIVNAMEAFFTRRAKRPRPRSFVAMDHLAKDVDKAMKLRLALDRAGTPAEKGAWDAVKEPLRADLRARALFGDWKRLQAGAPAPDAPGFLEHYDAERKVFKELVAMAEARLGEAAGPLREALGARLAEAELKEGTLVWRRAWDHHWSRIVCEAWGIA
jgi:hypothetical protein